MLTFRTRQCPELESKSEDRICFYDFKLVFSRRIGNLAHPTFAVQIITSYAYHLLHLDPQVGQFAAATLLLLGSSGLNQ